MSQRINLGTGDGRRSDWSTPDWLFSLLSQEFFFVLDVAASAKNAKCPRYFTKKQDALKQSWVNAMFGGTVAPNAIWMNPPYGQKELPLWMKKAYEASRSGCTVVCLVPARTDSRWWHEYAMRGEIRFVRGRVNFDNGNRKAPFASAVVVFKGLLDGEVRISPRLKSIESPPRRSKYGAPIGIRGLGVDAIIIDEVADA